MYFLVWKDRKIIFGLNPKCGCTFFKNIFRKLKNVKTLRKYNFYDISLYHGYTVIIIVRNIFDRVVSTFMDKYNFIKNPNYKEIYPWKFNEKLTFYNFVMKFVEKPFQLDETHLLPQFYNVEKELFNYFKKQNTLITYNLNNINYKELNQIINKNLVDKVNVLEIINSIHQTKHTNKLRTFDNVIYRKNVYHMTHSELYNLKHNYKKFYEEKLIEIINNFYRKDNIMINYLLNN